jgi:hypothetical protein
MSFKSFCDTCGDELRPSNTPARDGQGYVVAGSVKVRGKTFVGFRANPEAGKGDICSRCISEGLRALVGVAVQDDNTKSAERIALELSVANVNPLTGP